MSSMLNSPMKEWLNTLLLAIIRSTWRQEAFSCSPAPAKWIGHGGWSEASSFSCWNRCFYKVKKNKVQNPTAEVIYNLLTWKTLKNIAYESTMRSIGTKQRNITLALLALHQHTSTIDARTNNCRAWIEASNFISIFLLSRAFLQLHRFITVFLQMCMECMENQSNSRGWANNKNKRTNNDSGKTTRSISNNDLGMAYERPKWHGIAAPSSTSAPSPACATPDSIEDHVARWGWTSSIAGGYPLPDCDWTETSMANRTPGNETITVCLSQRLTPGGGVTWMNTKQLI